MGCKHEGGTDPCVRYLSGRCKVYNVQKQKLYRKNRPGYDRKYMRDYLEQNVVANVNCRGGRQIGLVGAASELLVSADLLARGYEVTRPLSAQAKHDLHVKIGGRWFGVQVKSAKFNHKTGKMRLNGGVHTRQSPILALVHLPLRNIEYRAGTEPLPKELETELEKSIQEHEKWRSASTAAASAKVKKLKGESDSSQTQLSFANTAENSSTTSPLAVI